MAKLFHTKALICLLALSSLLNLGYVYAAGKILNLQAVYELSKANSHKLKAAQASMLQSQTLLKEAKSAFLPVIGLEGRAGFSNLNTTLPDNSVANSLLNVATNDNHFSFNRAVSVLLEENVFNLSFWHQYHAAALNRQAHIYQAEIEKQNLIFDTANQYLATLASQDQMRYLSDKLKSTQTELTRAERKKKLGESVNLEIEQIKLSVLLTEDMLNKARVDYVNNLKTLEMQTGVRISRLMPLVNEVPIILPKPDREQYWLEKTNQLNPALTAGRSSLQALGEKIQAEKYHSWPSVKLKAAYGYEDAQIPVFKQARIQNKEILLTASMPIFTGGYLEASVQSAQAKYQHDWQLYQEKLQELDLIEAKIMNELDLLYQKLRTDKQALIVAQANLKATQNAYHLGEEDVARLLDAQNALLEVQTMYRQDTYNYLLLKLKLKQTAGLLSETDLNALNKMIQTA